MPIKLQVGSEFDEAEARRATAEAREYYKRQAAELKVEAKLADKTAKEVPGELQRILERQAVRLRVDAILNEDSAKEVMKEFERELKAHKNPEIEVDVNVDRNAISRAMSAVGEEVFKGSRSIISQIRDMGSAIAQTGNVAGLIGVSAMVPAFTGVAGVAASAAQSLWLLPAAAGAAGAAIGTLALGVQGFGDAMKEMGDPEKFAAALQTLAPNAQQAALHIKALVDGPLKEMKMATQDALFANVGPQLQSLVSTLGPSIQGLTTGVAGAFNQMFQGIASQLQTSGTQGAIQTFINNVVAAFKELAPAVAPLTRALADIMAVGSGFLPELAAAATEAARSFGQFISEAKQSGDLKRWMGEGLDTLKLLGEAAIELAKAFMALAPIGRELLPHIVDLLKGMTTTITTMTPVVTFLTDNFMGVFGAVKLVASAIDTVKSAFSGMDGIAQAVANNVVSAFNRVTAALNAVTAPIRWAASLIGVDIPEIPTVTAPTIGGSGGVTGQGSTVSENRTSRSLGASAATLPLPGPGAGGGLGASFSAATPSGPSWGPRPNPFAFTPSASGGGGGGGGGGTAAASASGTQGIMVTPENAISAIQFAQQQHGKPYGWGGAGPTVYDCSGFMSDIFAIMTGKPYTGSERFFTTEADFSKLGFEPGFQAGAFNIGVNRDPGGHMAGTLPNMVNVESGGSGGGVRYGAGAKGAKDFAEMYHLPVSDAFNTDYGATGLDSGSSRLVSGRTAPTGDGIPVFVTNMPGGGFGGGGGAGGGGGPGGAGGFDPLGSFFKGLQSGGGWGGVAGSIGQNIMDQIPPAAMGPAPLGGGVGPSLFTSGAPAISSGVGIGPPPGPAPGGGGWGGPMPGSMPGGMMPGTGMPQAAPFGAGGPGVGEAAGSQPPQPKGHVPGQGGWQPGASAGGGGGGLMGQAMSMFPGGQTASQLASRAIEFGGQALAIGASGIMETFLPAGSALGDPSKSWFGKMASGFGGARASIENTAGKAEPVQKIDPNTTEHGKGQGQPPGPAGDTFNINGSDPQSIAREVSRQKQVEQRQMDSHGAGMGW